MDDQAAELRRDEVMARRDLLISQLLLRLDAQQGLIAKATPDATDDTYRQQARLRLSTTGTVEPDARVSRQADGAWVEAWIYIPAVTDSTNPKV